MYLLDSNVFIAAKQQYYAFDIAPGFWQWLEQGHLAGKIFTVKSVLDEIVNQQDELSEWVKRQPPKFVLRPDQFDTSNLTRLATWATSGHFTQAAHSTFLASADYFLVAQAATKKLAVVTHELPDPASKKRVKIPDACLHMGVKYINTFQMLRVEGAKFRL